MNDKDLIKKAYHEVCAKKTNVNKFYLLKRYLRFKYNIDVNKECLLSRIKKYSKLF